MSATYDVAAYIWPSYQNDERARIFWPSGLGEWESVLSNRPKFEGHRQPRHPMWGYVNEADPYVMEMEIGAAADHGVNVFIYDWYWYDYRPFLEGCLNDGYLKARNNDREKFYLMWANHDATTLWDKRISGEADSIVWRGSQNREEFETICHRLIQQYFSHPSYYRIDGKPVFMIYDLNTLTHGLGGTKNTREALDWFRREACKAGLGGLHLQCTLQKPMKSNLTGITSDSVGTEQEMIRALGFDSSTHYQFCHFTNIDRCYSDILADVQMEWNRLSDENPIPYYPHVSIGWDNNPRFTEFRKGIITENAPEEFEKALSMAKQYIDNRPSQPPLITINSWNEWTESSYLEPDDMYGYGYLEAVKRVFKTINSGGLV